MQRYHFLFLTLLLERPETTSLICFIFHPTFPLAFLRHADDLLKLPFPLVREEIKQARRKET